MATKTHKKRRKKKNKGKLLKRLGLLTIILLMVAYVMIIFGRTIERKIVYWIYETGMTEWFERNHSQQANLKNFGIKLPYGYKVHGLDVSKYQRTINWKMVSEMNADSIRIIFAFIKATEGRMYFDPTFDYNWENSKKNNIIRGAYHYYKPDINSKKQAQNFMSVVDINKGDLPPVLDIEETGTLGADNMLKGIKNWLDIVEKHYGMKPVIYTYIRFYEDYLAGNKDFNEYPVWIAHYYHPKLITSQKWHFWQHNDKGHISGIKGKVDFNVFNGDKTELMKMLK